MYIKKAKALDEDDKNCTKFLRRRMVLLCNGFEAGPEMLPEDMFNFAGKENVRNHGSNLKSIQEQTEREQITKTLKEVKVNESRAARLLHITRKTLYDKMKKYGLG